MGNRRSPKSIQLFGTAQREPETIDDMETHSFKGLQQPDPRSL